MESVVSDSEVATLGEATLIARNAARQHAWDAMADPPIAMSNGEYRFYTQADVYVTYIPVTTN